MHVQNVKFESHKEQNFFLSLKSFIFKIRLIYFKNILQKFLLPKFNFQDSNYGTIVTRNH